MSLSGDRVEVSIEFYDAALALLRAVVQPVAPEEWERRVNEAARRLDEIVVRDYGIGASMIDDRTDRQRVGDDVMVTYPPMMFWQSDLDRLRAWAEENHIGDSAMALRRLLDVVSEPPSRGRA